MGDPINCFPGYEYKKGEDGKYHNYYRGVDLGKGGWVYSEPGIYSNIALFDVASLHPASIINLNKLGDYTHIYADLRKARVYVKHGNYDEAGKLFDGKLKKYLTDENVADALSAALKLPLNSFFGVSFASFENPARDSRDVNNIIALRGALFMKTLFDAVVERGYDIIHVKTDSIKVVNADTEIIEFIKNFSTKYGYEMEHEAAYERICLLDKAQYVATFMSPEKCEKMYGYIPTDNKKHFKKKNHPWTTTGDAFQHPYIFKTIFSGEPVTFEDMCEVKTVKTSIYIDMNENLPDVSQFENELKKRMHNQNNPENAMKLNPNLSSYTNEELKRKIDTGHDYQFVGRVGNFFPVINGVGGGYLYRIKDGKFDSVNGTKGYRWIEAEKAKEEGKENYYSHEYFDKLIDDAIKSINSLGSFERFIDLSKPYEPPDDISPAADDMPPWSTVPCGDGKYNTCMDCPNYKDNICKRGYSLDSYIHEGSGQ